MQVLLFGMLLNNLTTGYEKGHNCFRQCRFHQRLCWRSGLQLAHKFNFFYYTKSVLQSELKQNNPMSLSDFSESHICLFVCLLPSVTEHLWLSVGQFNKTYKERSWTSVTTDVFYCSEVKMISHCTTASFFFSSRMKLSCILLFCSNNARFYASPLFPLCSPLLPSFHPSILPSSHPFSLVPWLLSCFSFCVHLSLFSPSQFILIISIGSRWSEDEGEFPAFKTRMMNWTH